MLARQPCAQGAPARDVSAELPVAAVMLPSSAYSATRRVKTTSRPVLVRPDSDAPWAAVLGPVSADLRVAEVMFAGSAYGATRRVMATMSPGA